MYLTCFVLVPIYAPSLPFLPASSSALHHLPSLTLLPATVSHPLSRLGTESSPFITTVQQCDMPDLLPKGLGVDPFPLTTLIAVSADYHRTERSIVSTGKQASPINDIHPTRPPLSQTCCQSQSSNAADKSQSTSCLTSPRHVTPSPATARIARDP